MRIKSTPRELSSQPRTGRQHFVSAFVAHCSHFVSRVVATVSDKCRLGHKIKGLTDNSLSLSLSPDPLMYFVFFLRRGMPAFYYPARARGPKSPVPLNNATAHRDCFLT